MLELEQLQLYNWKKEQIYFKGSKKKKESHLSVVKDCPKERQDYVAVRDDMQNKKGE